MNQTDMRSSLNSPTYVHNQTVSRHSVQIEQEISFKEFDNKHDFLLGCLQYTNKNRDLLQWLINAIPQKSSLTMRTEDLHNKKFDYKQFSYQGVWSIQIKIKIYCNNLPMPIPIGAV